MTASKSGTLVKVVFTVVGRRPRCICVIIVKICSPILMQRCALRRQNFTDENLALHVIMVVSAGCLLVL